VRGHSWWKPAVLGMAALLIAGAGLIANDGTSARAAQKVNVQAGGGDAGIAVNVFSPSTLAVSVGDTVTWTNPFTEPHSVAFVAGNGQIADFEAAQNASAAKAFDGTQTFSSGLFAGGGMFAANGDSFSVTFKQSGQYKFFCTIHPGMEVNVTVVDGGYTPPVDASRIQKRVQTGIDLGLAAANAIKAPDPRPVANGTKDWTIPTPPSIPYEGSVVDVLRFTPAEISIGAGDTVTWQNDSFTPHTVTFIPAAPPADFSPFVAEGVTSTYEPGQFLTSGLIANPALGDGLGVPIVGTSFSLTFDKPGTYTYICALHADSGMVGVIHVGAAGSGGITPPSTGDAGLKDQHSGGYWMMLAGVALLLGSFAAGTLVAVRRQS
jgi:plastocyanin